eukprot:TRINITY_DN7334_c0_g1_i1.p1 TRINITY_DN7334_c0_g1~~TRINITY_DN7334_c0_g1_i1.p1  ORF type:complete len:417 (-),score=114.79 TRINITY_DN7334_c0_g1_i1:192-1412(-)
MASEAADIALTLSVVAEYLEALCKVHRADAEAAGIDIEQLEVASQCLSDLVSSNPPQLTLHLHDKNLSLPLVISAGLKALLPSPASAAPAAAATSEAQPQYSQPFLDYMKKLQDSGFFGKQGELSPESDEYKARVSKAVEKWRVKFGSPYGEDSSEKKTANINEAPSPSAATVTAEPSVSEPSMKPSEAKPPRIVSDAEIEQAEKYKSEGNSKLTAGDFDGAIQSYTKAMELNPNQSIYPANRAAAYLKVYQFQAAIDDCKLAIELNPQYVKAYYRLGTAYQKMDDLENAKKILQQGLKVAEESGDASMVSAIKSELQSLNGGGAGDFDLGSILSNPMFGQMAQQMMANPQMMESMLGSFGAGGGASGPGPAASPPPEMRDKIEKLKSDPKFAVRWPNCFMFPLFD